MTDEVSRKIRHLWPYADPDAILSILRRYGDTIYERDQERVHLAIIKLSEGWLERLPELVSIAKRDPRKILAFAEMPEEIKTGPLKMRNLPAEDSNAIRQRDRQQYQNWLRR